MFNFNLYWEMMYCKKFEMYMEIMWNLNYCQNQTSRHVFKFFLSVCAFKRLRNNQIYSAVRLADNETIVDKRCRDQNPLN